MKTNIAIFVATALIASGHAVACTGIAGKYKSVSETHWNFELVIGDDKAILTYTNYFYGLKQARAETQTISYGFCEAVGDSYRLTFAEKTLTFNYHPQLSHRSYGGEGYSPGIVGEFIENRKVELWVGL